MKSEILEPAEASPFLLHSYFTFHPLPTIQSSGNSRLLHRDLHPGRYVGAEEVEEDGEPFDEKMPRLISELEAQFMESAKLEAQIRANLAGIFSKSEK